MRANPAHFQNFIATTQISQRLDRRFNDVGVIARAERLGEDVANSGRLDDRAHTAARDDAGPRRSRPQQHPAATEFPIVSCGMVFSCSETFSIDLRAASEALRIASATSFALPKPTPTFAIVIARHDQRAKAETASAFHHLGAAIDENHFLGGVASCGAALYRCRDRIVFPGFGEGILKFQSPFARGICERFHLAVEYVTAAIKHHVLQFLCQQLLRDCFAHAFCGFTIRGRFLPAKSFCNVETAAKVFTGIVIDHVRVNMTPGKMDGESRPFCGSAHFLPDTGMNALPRCLRFVAILTAPSCLPCGESARRRIARLCPCTARADNIREYPLRLGRPVSCRSH